MAPLSLAALSTCSMSAKFSARSSPTSFRSSSSASVGPRLASCSAEARLVASCASCSSRNCWRVSPNVFSTVCRAPSATLIFACKMASRFAASQSSAEPFAIKVPAFGCATTARPSAAARASSVSCSFRFIVTSCSLVTVCNASFATRSSSHARSLRSNPTVCSCVAVRTVSSSRCI